MLPSLDQKIDLHNDPTVINMGGKFMDQLLNILKKLHLAILKSNHKRRTKGNEISMNMNALILNR